MLKALEVKYGTLYRRDNVVLSGTHTHGGPAGYFQYTLLFITSKGYVKASVKALVDGIVQVCACVCVYVCVFVSFVFQRIAIAQRILGKSL